MQIALLKCRMKDHCRIKKCSKASNSLVKEKEWSIRRGNYVIGSDDRLKFADETDVWED